MQVCSLVDMPHKEQSFGIIPLRRVGEAWEIFLVVHRHGLHVGFPKGHADLGEDEILTATRELKEETGLSVQHRLQEEVYTDSYTLYRDDQLTHKTVRYFPCLVEGSPSLQKEEILFGGWYPLSHAYLVLTFEGVQRIAKALYHKLRAMPPSSCNAV